ncbi:MAG: SDR family NAD(P)-dependent oxidoreductase, partial [Candidatus Adiutrix sp.]|nr:SDR family NAD(P)-dependent oxidoreductase [Candidatus Adiutrix sp.]
AEASPDNTPLDLLLYPPDLASAENQQAWAEAFAEEAPRVLALRAAYQGLEEILGQFGLRPTAVINELEGPVDLAEALKGHTANLWVDLGTDGAESPALHIVGAERFLPLDADAGGALGLARLLGRLAALGQPLDLTAWPLPPLETAPAEDAPERSFTMTISGANQFTKKVIPPSPRRVPEGAYAAAAEVMPKAPAPPTEKVYSAAAEVLPKGPAETPAQAVAESLEALAAETARLHQEFLNQQAETLRLLGQSLGAGTPAPAASPAPVMAAPPKAANGNGLAKTSEAVLQIVADETGYPLTMLNLDMDLEADLGLDSIKKVEIMAELSEKMPGVQGLGAETMNQAATLRDLVALAAAESSVADYAMMAPAAAPVYVPVTAPAYAPAAEPPVRRSNGLAHQAPAAMDSAAVWTLLREVVAAETGYPLEMLSPAMRLGDDLGLDSIRLVEIASLMSEKLPDADVPGAELVHGAQTLGDLAEALGSPGQPQNFPCDGAAPAPGAASASSANAAEVILETVSRETGYPRDMLAMHMNLEADLGLDSIKKVEIMAALSEQLPQLEALATADVMSGLETLGDLAALAGGGSQPCPAPAYAPVAAPAAPANAVNVTELLLDVVAAETGYPKDMLRLDAALEADLGLDSIKRVEIMAALSEKLGDDSLGAAAAEPLNAAVTLGDLVTMLGGSQPGAGAEAWQPAPVRAAAAPAVAAAASEIPPKRKVGRPRKNSLPPFKDADAPPAIEPTTTAVTVFQVEMAPVTLSGQKSFDLSPNAKAVVVAEAGSAAEALERLLTRQGQRPERLGWAEADRLAELADIEGLFLLWPGQSNDFDLPKQAFRALKAAAPALLATAERGRKPLIMGLTFQGGGFGFAEAEETAAPASGALSGLLKTAAREWPSLRVRSVDLPAVAYAPEAADVFLEDIPAAADPVAPLELAHPSLGRWTTPKLSPYKSKNIRVRHLREGQTILVTGGARGVTAAVVRELARSFKPRLVILGRTPLPAEEPRWLRHVSGENAVRQVLFDRAEVKPGPRELASQSAAIMAGREIRENLAAFEKAGAKVVYRSGDFRDPSVVRETIADVKRFYGPVHGFIHGAGVLADSLILDKKEEDFDRVFDTKARLAEGILAELSGHPLNFVAFFSSSTARFGRRGQADYAAGNEVLNKLAQALSMPGNRQAPKCLSVNWGPWAGGMVDAGLTRLFESEGVGLIPLGEGARLFAGLAGAPKNDPVELVVLGPDTDMEALL